MIIINNLIVMVLLYLRYLYLELPGNSLAIYVKVLPARCHIVDLPPSRSSPPPRMIYYIAEHPPGRSTI